MKKQARQGLYDPHYEHDSCGVGFVVNVKGTPSHKIIKQGLEVLLSLAHRGACGCEPNTGDGADTRPARSQVGHGTSSYCCRTVLDLPQRSRE